MHLTPLAVSLGSLLLSSPCLAQEPNWVQVNTKNSPVNRLGHAMAHDFIRARTIVFAGWSTGTTVYRNDTWEFDGKDWTQLKPKTVPSARYLSSMVFHVARVQTVLFGGANTTTFLNDTWTWDGKDWTQLKPKTSPPPRMRHAMAYDSARQRTVLFGGLRNQAFLNDTWEWDGVNWTQIKTTNAPSPRYAPIAYDSARKRIVLFGGYDNVTTVFNDTWEFDGKDWTKVNPWTRPSKRCCSALAYDIARKRTVLFGGLVSSGNANDTWEYDGRDWVLMTPTTSPPGRHDNDNMVYDIRRQRMVMFGGFGFSGRLGDTWEYVGPQSLTGSPSTISIATGGTQTFNLDAGTLNRNRLYWVFGSVTGTSPGVTLASAVGSVTIPLNPDPYTDITIGLANTPLLTKTRGALNTVGKGTATLNVPKNLPTAAIGAKLYHAYLVYDANNNFYMASNPVELMLVK